VPEPHNEPAARLAAAQNTCGEVACQTSKPSTEGRMQPDARQVAVAVSRGRARLDRRVRFGPVATGAFTRPGLA